MAGKRKVHSANFKGKVALEAIRGLKPINVLASEYGVQPNQISIWKKSLKEGIPGIFSNKRGKAKINSDSTDKQLFEEIGRLKMERDWLKKKVDQF
jgi:transposase